MMQYYLYKGALFSGRKLLDDDSFEVFCAELLASADSDPAIGSVDMLDLYDHVAELIGR